MVIALTPRLALVPVPISQYANRPSFLSAECVGERASRVFLFYGTRMTSDEVACGQDKQKQTNKNDPVAVSLDNTLS